MRKLLALFAVIASGCSAEISPDGTYVAPNGLRVVLSRDHSYRVMNGERTSPTDVVGTYTIAGGKLELTPQGAHGKAQAAFSGDSFTLGVQTFKRQ